MSVFANQGGALERMFVKYFQRYFELVMSELQHSAKGDSASWTNGLQDIQRWGDDTMRTEVEEFRKMCPDADTLMKGFDIDCDLSTFLKRTMIDASRSPAIIDRHYWSYPHRDRQSFLSDSITMTARAVSLETRTATRSSVVAADPSPKILAPAPAQPTATNSEHILHVPPSPDESVSQAAAQPMPEAPPKFTFDDTTSHASRAVSLASQRFPSQTQSKSKQSVKEFSVISTSSRRSLSRPPQSLRDTKSMPNVAEEFDDMTTGIEVA